MTLARRADVAVIGGGIVGLAAALACAMRGKRVVVIDPGDVRRQASFGNAGVISRGSLFPVAGPALWRNLPGYLCHADPALRIRYASLPSMMRWIGVFLCHANERACRRAAAALDPLTGASFVEHLRLAAATGAAHLVRRCGYLKLYRTERSFAATALERAILGEHHVRSEVLSADDIAAAEPALTRRFARGLLFPESGTVERPAALLDRYRATLVERGGRLIDARVDGIEPGPDHVRVGWNGGSLEAAAVVVAAGAWSGALTRPLGYRFPLAAERGYHRHYRTRVSLTRPVHDVDGAYVLAPCDGEVRLLTGVELARPDDPPSPTQLARVLPEAAGTLALAEPVDAEPWCGSRPSTPDGLPIIGRAPSHPNVLLAFGHGHIGFSTGPITGRIVADLIDGAAPPIPIAPFAPERFVSGSQPASPSRSS